MSDERTIPLRTLRDTFKRQYRAGLVMLLDATERCPDRLWDDATPTNAFWQIAYHTLFFTHFYLAPREAAFRPWAGHQGDVQHADGIAGPPAPGDTRPLLPTPYSKDDVAAYVAHVDAILDEAVDALDLLSPDSGFWWYRIPKLEHQLVNLRHLQHHAAQLADRVRAATGSGVEWVGSVGDE
jgi:hypothetical protein